MQTTTLSSVRRLTASRRAAGLDATAAAHPVIRPEGIRWRGGLGKRPLVIELTFENPHSRWTQGTQAALRSAEFGTFQPWRPVRSVEVPPIAPGARITLTLGGNLTADVDRGQLNAWGRMLRREASLARGIPIQEAVHFVGNFDLIVGKERSTERHWGHLAGLKPGRRNIAFFKVGDGCPDTYRFRVAACDSDWEVVLACRGQEDLLHGSDVRIAREVVEVGITPPAYVSTGNVVIATHRASTNEDGFVEFTLDTVGQHHD